MAKIKMRHASIALCTPAPTSYAIHAAWSKMPRGLDLTVVTTKALRAAGHPVRTYSRYVPEDLVIMARELSGGNLGDGVRALLGIAGIEPYASCIQGAAEKRSENVVVSLRIPARYHAPGAYKTLGELLDVGASMWSSTADRRAERSAVAAAWLRTLGNEDRAVVTVRIREATHRLLHGIGEGNVSSGARTLLAVLEAQAA